jgi:dihydroorotase
MWNKNKGNKGKILLHNCIIVTANGEEKSQLLIEGDKISEIAKEIKTDKSVEKIDCKGLHLCPGIVDPFVNIGEPGGEYKASLENTAKSAAAGGITTFGLQPTTNPVIDSTSMVEYIKNRALEKSLCNVVIFGSLTKKLQGKEISEIGLLKKAGVVGLSQGYYYLTDTNIFRRAAEYASNFDMTICQLPQDEYLSKNGVINEGKISTKIGVQGIPSVAEKIALERDLTIAEWTGVNYHATSISTKLAVDCIKSAKKKLKGISCSTTPHHIMLTEDQALSYRTFAKTNPPLRTELDRQSLISALKDGTVDFISTNHSPRSEDQKRVSLFSAEFGVIGLETLFSATYSALKGKGFSLSELMNVLSLKPAKFLGLEKRGEIKKGYIADLILVDINKKYKINPEKFEGIAVNSPFDEMELTGKIKRTFVSGELVYDENK